MGLPLPSTDTDICNLALDRLGQRSIASLSTPTTEVEQICARHYAATRRELLRRYIFNFAKKYVNLLEDGTKTPAFGFASAYALPPDFIRLLALGNVTHNEDLFPSLFDLSEGYIFTDSGTDGSLSTQYIYDATTVSKYDPLFVRLFSLHLAANMAYKFTLKNALVSAIREDAADAALAAAAISGQEKPPRRVERSRFRDVRRRGSYLRDNTRV